MKKIKHHTVAVLTLLCSVMGFAQNQSDIKDKINKDINPKNSTMKTYVIEREIPEAGKLTPQQLKGISQKSNEVLAEMGPQIEWLHSYVTDDKVYCVYRAENEKLIRKHAEKGGFPANKISELSTTIDPSTAKN